jgi:hypothetical protein
VTASTPRQSPYQSLLPFGEGDADFFFGRDNEIRVVIANLFASPLTIVYGPSGVGKSSLLHAGVVPELRRLGKAVVAPYSQWHAEPALALRARVAQAAGVGSAQEAGRQTLSEFCEGICDRAGRPLMLLLDQFEEYFVYTEPFSGFDEELGALLGARDLPLSILVSIREDSIAKLDRFEGRVPHLFDNYLRIEHLDEPGATAAIEDPLPRYVSLTGQAVTIEPALVDAVLPQVQFGAVVLGEIGKGIVAKEESSHQRYEAAYLQLVMSRLWEEERKAGSRVLRRQTLDQLGGAKYAVRTHLDRMMQELEPADQDQAAELFHYLVTPSGTKIAHRVQDLAAYTGLPMDQVATLLAKLSEPRFRILRPVGSSNAQPGMARYEAYHDILAKAILEWRSRHEVSKVSLSEDQLRRREDFQVQLAELLKLTESSLEEDRVRAARLLEPLIEDTGRLAPALADRAKAALRDMRTDPSSKVRSTARNALRTNQLAELRLLELEFERRAIDRPPTRDEVDQYLRLLERFRDEGSSEVRKEADAVAKRWTPGSAAPSSQQEAAPPVRKVSLTIPPLLRSKGFWLFLLVVPALNIGALLGVDWLLRFALQTFDLPVPYGWTVAIVIGGLVWSGFHLYEALDNSRRGWEWWVAPFGPYGWAVGLFEYSSAWPINHLISWGLSNVVALMMLRAFHLPFTPVLYLVYIALSVTELYAYSESQALIFPSRRVSEALSTRRR